MPSFVRDPSSTLDYAVDWSKWLPTGDTITTSLWTVPAGLATPSAAGLIQGAKTVVWISGGTAGQVYKLTNRITTATGRTDERTLTIHVQDR